MITSNSKDRATISITVNGEILEEETITSKCGHMTTVDGRSETNQKENSNVKNYI